MFVLHEVVVLFIFVAYLCTHVAAPANIPWLWRINIPNGKSICWLQISLLQFTGFLLNTHSISEKCTTFLPRNKKQNKTALQIFSVCYTFCSTGLQQCEVIKSWLLSCLGSFKRFSKCLKQIICVCARAPIKMAAVNWWRLQLLL